MFHTAHAGQMSAEAQVSGSEVVGTGAFASILVYTEDAARQLAMHDPFERLTA
jgi:predicted amino acid dehydrogenase